VFRWNIYLYKKVLLIVKMKSHGKLCHNSQLLDCLTNMSISIEVTFQDSKEINYSGTVIKGISLLVYNETKCHTPIFSTN